MTQPSKRSLRERRPPHHFNDVNHSKIQTDEIQGVGYARLGNLKASKASTEDYSSPAQEMNYLAKLLSKFVHSVSKNLKQNGMIDLQKQEGQKIKSNIQEKNKFEINNETIKKKIQNKLQPKNVGNTYKKEQQKQKDQLQKQFTNRQTQKKQESIAKDKNKYKQGNGPNLNQNDQHQSNYLNLFNQINQQKPPSISQFDREATQKAIQKQQQMLLNSNSHLRSQLFPMKPVVEKAPQSKDKLFGRASYHVAIAYHIHLKNVKESGVDINSQSILLDPTYYAKKLKGEAPAF